MCAPALDLGTGDILFLYFLRLLVRHSTPRSAPLASIDLTPACACTRACVCTATVHCVLPMCRQARCIHVDASVALCPLRRRRERHDGRSRRLDSRAHGKWRGGCGASLRHGCLSLGAGDSGDSGLHAWSHDAAHAPLLAHAWSRVVGTPQLQWKADAHCLRRGQHGYSTAKAWRCLAARASPIDALAEAAAATREPRRAECTFLYRLPR